MVKEVYQEVILGQNCIWLSDTALHDLYFLKIHFIKSSLTILWTKGLLTQEVHFYKFLAGKNALSYIYQMLPSISIITGIFILFYVVQTTWSGFFPAMLSGAPGTTLPRIFPMQCCPRSIKATLNRIFLCILLFGASQTTLHRVFICVTFSQNDLLGQHCTWKTLCSVALEAPDKLFKKKSFSMLS